MKQSVWQADAFLGGGISKLSFLTAVASCFVIPFSPNSCLHQLAWRCRESNQRQNFLSGRDLNHYTTGHPHLESYTLQRDSGESLWAKCPFSLSYHVGFTPRWLYNSNSHSPECIVQLETGWTQDAWLQWSNFHLDISQHSFQLSICGYELFWTTHNKSINGSTLFKCSIRKLVNIYKNYTLPNNCRDAIVFPSSGCIINLVRASSASFGFFVPSQRPGLLGVDNARLMMTWDRGQKQNSISSKKDCVWTLSRILTKHFAVL